MPSLDKVLLYQNENVVARFADDHGVTEQEAQEIFLEAKRWLWLCAKLQRAAQTGEGESFKLPLFNEAYAIDLMWHIFLLHTEDYAEFCQTHFGFFIHHHPKTRAERLAWQQKIADDPVAARIEREQNLRRVYDYLYDELGEEVLVRWCEEFPSRFQFD